MVAKTRSVVIVGAGFAGIQVAHTLIKKGLPKGGKLTLISDKNIHVYTADLYEIATAFHEKITEQCLTKLRDTVALPLSKILRSQSCRFVQDTVHQIDPTHKKLTLAHGEVVPFDYLALCMGSIVNYYDIPGLEKFSYPLKTLNDALAANCYLDHFFQNLWKNQINKKISILIGGGGATGVEYACELRGYVEKLCGKYQYPLKEVHISIIEGGEQLCGSGEKGTVLIEERCRNLGIKVMRNTLIRKVAADSVEIETDRGERSTLPMDILIWTGGVMPHPLIRASFKNVARSGALPVNEFLQNPNYPFIFAAGDNAYIEQKVDKKPLPMLAQLAVQEGETVGKNIYAALTSQPMTVFVPKFKGMIIPLGGMYALFKSGELVLMGLSLWVLRRLVDLKYALSILPFGYALRKWWHDTNVFLENDE